MSAENFLDGVLGRLFPTPKKPKRAQNPAYGRLYRWCKKNGITYERDMSFWDFADKRIGTICLEDGIRDRFAYDQILELAKKRIATGDPTATLNDEVEAYRFERAEARAVGDTDFPTYSEWSKNGSDPDAERKRAEARMDQDDYYRDLY